MSEIFGPEVPPRAEEKKEDTKGFKEILANIDKVDEIVGRVLKGSEKGVAPEIVLQKETSGRGMDNAAARVDRIRRQKKETNAAGKRAELIEKMRRKYPK